MGLCSEVADGGAILKKRPALGDQIRAVASPRFSAQNPEQNPLGLFAAAGVEPFGCDPDQMLAWDIASLGE